MKIIVFNNRRLFMVFGSAVILAGIIWAAADHRNLHWFQNPNYVLSGQYFASSNAWIALGGSWTADASGIGNTSEERGAKLIARDRMWKNIQIDADIQIAEPFAEAGFIIRSNAEEEGVDAYHGYFAGIRAMDSSIELGRADFGWRALAHASIPATVGPDGWYHLHVVAVDCTLGMRVTAAEGVSSALVSNDENCIRSGGFGLRSSFSSARWKNLRVTTANESDIATLKRDVGNTSTAHDPLLPEPSSPPYADNYMASAREEATRHRAQPHVTPISYFRLSPGPHPDVTIQGTVISLPPFIDIQDDTSSIYLPDVDLHTPIKLGDFVEASGTLVSKNFRSTLQDAELRVLWSDLPIPPLAVTAAQLTGGEYRGRYIEVEGTLLSARAQANGYEFVLKDGNQEFRAFAQTGFHLQQNAFEPGSRLRLRGNATSLDRFTSGVYPYTVIADRVDLVSAPPWWSPVHVLWLALACLALFAGILWALHRVQAWHMRSLLKEREELAFEMHDTLAQSFTGIAYQLQAASLENRGPREVQAHIQNALKMVDISHREAGRTVAALRPQFRAASDIVATLDELAERLIDGGDLVVKSNVSGRIVELPLAVTDALFRIGQEAVTNAVQHAGCKNLEIFLELTSREARLTIRDDGCGFANSPQTTGLGIAGMKNRAAKVNARFDFATAPSGGTCVTVVAPLPRAIGLFSRAQAFLRTTFALKLPL
jgi:signal transduction histidine kinase